MGQDNKMKAVTFSYDDGVYQDERLVKLFNKYNLKCTFNLNSGIQTGASRFDKEGISIHRMNIKGLKELYQGHEIAVHSLTHPFLEKQNEETIYNEIMQDKLNLEKIFERKIRGMAYPYGTYNQTVINIAKQCGIEYARTVMDADDFNLSDNLMELKSTCHHKNQNLMKLAKEFVEIKSDKPQVFYIWGHSYEFDVDDNWNVMEELCEYISGREDIFYGTNEEVLLDRKGTIL